MATLRPIVLATDFGPDSAYVGQMKLVIHKQIPNAVIHDLAHDILPQSINAAVLTLKGARRFFPKEAVIVVVVDPGVGSERKIVAAKTECGQIWVAPDNGLLISLLDSKSEVYSVENQDLFLEEISSVFHGRDIFAPTAAHLAKGTPIEEVGPKIQWDEMEKGTWLEPIQVSENSVKGQIVLLDSFGNAVSNLGGGLLSGNVSDWELTFKENGKEVTFPMHSSYSDVRGDEGLGLVGSFGFIELAVRNGSVIESFDIDVGTEIGAQKKG